jgi:hypothetical protein
MTTQEDEMVSNKHATSEKKGNWGSFGGDTKMHSFKGVGTQAPGGSAVDGQGGGRRDQKAQAGSASAGFYSSDTKNKFGAGTQEPGSSSQAGKRQDGFAHGGSTHMFGNRGSQRQGPA